MPPTAQMPAVYQNGNPLHAPISTSPGRLSTTAVKVPAEDATVCTMLFSSMFELLAKRSTPIEITAAGIDVAMPIPTLSAR